MHSLGGKLLHLFRDAAECGMHANGVELAHDALNGSSAWPASASLVVTGSAAAI